MNATSIQPILIQKEQVSQLHFPGNEILQSSEEIRLRRAELDRALILGNVDHNKVKVVFVDNEGFKVVETTIWAVTDQRIVLKSGAGIPIHRITEIVT